MHVHGCTFAAASHSHLLGMQWLLIITSGPLVVMCCLSYITEGLTSHDNQFSPTLLMSQNLFSSHHVIDPTSCLSEMCCHVQSHWSYIFIVIFRKCSQRNCCIRKVHIHTDNTMSTMYVHICTHQYTHHEHVI